VGVIDSRNVMEDIDGLIGMDVFSQFLVTLDYPMQKLLLGPLPPRPGEAAAAPALKTSNAEWDDSEASEEPAVEAGQDKPAVQGTESGLKAPVVGSNATAPAQSASVKITPPRGPYDRYIAPEMKDYTAAYRVGHNLILPTALNDGKRRLFILDTGAFATVISPQAAHEVAKIHSEARLQVEGISGKVGKAYIADEVTFTFGRISREAEGVVSFDTSHISKDVGMEISGFLGADTLYLLTINIDYRDGLVKFDYDPNRGYRF
jgi:hypothetical protein